jgi:hypothetical protein
MEPEVARRPANITEIIGMARARLPVRFDLAWQRGTPRKQCFSRYGLVAGMIG